ncbi:hypothetical protein, partial [Hydrogenophaga sp. 2FB]|uniref:hypothetical protein n=1 Tax=Hydrogenophaga sp. 2FB TaxID=2502187 RepID=UPI001BB272ED
PLPEPPPPVATLPPPESLASEPEPEQPASATMAVANRVKPARAGPWKRWVVLCMDILLKEKMNAADAPKSGGGQQVIGRQLNNFNCACVPIWNNPDCTRQFGNDRRPNAV